MDYYRLVLSAKIGCLRAKFGKQGGVEIDSDWLECPSKEIWESRRRWFQEQDELFCVGRSYLLSEQACALSCEVENAFCAGAWIAVIVLAMAVVDAQLRETEFYKFEGSTKRLLEELDVNKDLQKLRERRNAIIHIDPDNPAITMDQQITNREELEKEARNAVKLMFEAFYLSPGT